MAFQANIRCLHSLRSLRSLHSRLTTSSVLLTRRPALTMAGLSSVNEHSQPRVACTQVRGLHKARAATQEAPPSADVQKEQKEHPSGYQMPPKEIAQIVDMPAPPGLSFSPDRKKVLQMYRGPPNPPIAELARPELKLAGLRIDAEIWARSRMSYSVGYGLLDFTDDLIVPAAEDKEVRIGGFREGSWLNFPSWSEDSRYLAFTVRNSGDDVELPREPLELWVAEVATGQARRLVPGLNSIFSEYTWIDADTIAAFTIPPGRSSPPPRPPAPIGPRVQDNTLGLTAQARTYQDLLKDPYDEELLEFYTTSVIQVFKVSTGELLWEAPPRMYTGLAPSPDGSLALATWLERPFSFNVPCGRFPKRVELWDRQGKRVRELAYLPLAEDIPIAFNSCRKGPRGFDWRDDKPAELCWMEAQDEGDPAIEVSPRDIVYTLTAEAAMSGGEPQELARTDFRCGGVSWCDEQLALVYESWWKTRRSIIHTVQPDDRAAGMKVLFDRNYEDAYTDPGSPAMRRTSHGTYVIATLEGADGSRRLLMQGSGDSPEGRRPFLDILDLETRETQRMWQSSPPFYEYTSSILSDQDDRPIMLEGLSLLLSRETVSDPPQYFIRTWHDGPGAEPTERRLSDFPHPYPSLRDLQKEIIRYKRADGVDLTATLYLPPGYDAEKDGPLPCIMWAYPREFKSKDAAGQMRKSPHRFSGIGDLSPLLWLTRGYAVLDGPTMPIVAEGDEEPNDTYVEQLTASAQAAVEELKRRGVADPARIAVGGHSYGAFMAANLLVHAPELFACGIARSGAYNRTLTPFGFQAEERTLWQAADTYAAMSPFMNAHRVQKPLLLIHGEDDNNTGTFPMQSERFYAALKGHGVAARLVLLPHESHGYNARESVMHCLWEMDAWLRRYCEESQSGSENGSENGASNGHAKL